MNAEKALRYKSRFLSPINEKVWRGGSLADYNFDKKLYNYISKKYKRKKKTYEPTLLPKAIVELDRMANDKKLARKIAKWEGKVKPYQKYLRPDAEKPKLHGRHSVKKPVVLKKLSRYDIINM